VHDFRFNFYQFECAHCPEEGEPYRGTVTVSGNCYYKFNVNYIAYGRMMRNCYDYFGSEAYSVGNMLNLIADWKSVYRWRELEDASEWAALGWYRGALDPSLLPPADVDAELSNCGPWQTILKDGTTAPGTFTIRWGDKDDPDCEPVEF